MKKNIFYFLFMILIMHSGSCTKESAKTGFNSSGKGGSLARFTVAGNYLYLVDKTHLKTFDISNPAVPALKDSTDVGFEIETIYPFKDRLFIGSTSVVHIFSIDDPSRPEKLGTAVSPDVLRRCDPVVARDTVAYATLRTNGLCGGTESILAVYNIKDILQPVQVNSYFINEPYGLGYADNALYVCDRSSLMVFDISDAYNPVFLKTIPDDQYIDVIPNGNTLVCWIAGGIVLYDISDRFDPKLIVKIS